MLNNYLCTLIPLGACLGSVITCFISYFYFCSQNAKKNYTDFHLVASSDDEALDQIAHASQQYTMSIPPYIEKLEITIILIEISIATLLLIFSGSILRYTDLTPVFASTISSTYLFLSLQLRLTRQLQLYIDLLLHSVILYTLQWTCLPAIVHTAILGNSERNFTIATLVRFAPFTLLCLFNSTAPRISSQLYEENNVLYMEPSKDETASILSRMTLSWANQLV
jgi:hypothetical protein